MATTRRVRCTTMTKSLFVNRQLNYNEAVRRLRYWSTDGQVRPERALSAVRMLTAVLEREKDNLYFEVNQ